MSAFEIALWSVTLPAIAAYLVWGRQSAGYPASLVWLLLVWYCLVGYSIVRHFQGETPNVAYFTFFAVLPVSLRLLFVATTLLFLYHMYLRLQWEELIQYDLSYFYWAMSLVMVGGGASNLRAAPVGYSSVLHSPRNMFLRENTPKSQSP